MSVWPTSRLFISGFCFRGQKAFRLFKGFATGFAASVRRDFGWLGRGGMILWLSERRAIIMKFLGLFWRRINRD